MASNSSSSIRATTRAPEPQRDRLIEEELERTRRQLKGVDVFAALLTLAAGSLGYLMVMALVDHWIIPHGLGLAGRAVACAVLVGAIVLYASFRLLPLVVRRINPIYAAQTIEQSRPSLKNSIINFLLLRSHQSELAPVIYEAVQQRAAADLAGAPAESTIDRSRLVKLSYVLVAIVAVSAFYKILSPKDPWRSIGRIVAPWANIAVPTRVRIEAIEPGDTQVFQDARLKVSAQIRGIGPDDPVTLYYSTADSQVVRQPIRMRLPEGSYRYSAEVPDTSSGLSQDSTYYITAGDAVSPTYQIHVATAPTITVERVDYKYPAYTELEPRSVERQGDLQAIEGTLVTLHARASHDIKKASVDFERDGKLDLPMRPRGREAQVEFPLNLKDRQAEHKNYQLEYINSQGESNGNPTMYHIEVIRDLPPEVAIVEPKVDPKQEIPLAERSRLRLVIEASDPDFKLKQVTVHARRGNEMLLIDQQLAEKNDERAGKFRKQYDFWAKSERYALRAGNLVELWVEAIDNKTPEPNRAETAHLKIRIGAPQSQQDQLADARDKQRQPPDAPPPEGGQNQQNNRDQQRRPGAAPEERNDRPPQQGERDQQNAGKEQSNQQQNGAQPQDKRVDPDDPGKVFEKLNEDNEKQPPQSGDKQQQGGKQNAGKQANNDQQNPGENEPTPDKKQQKQPESGSGQGGSGQGQSGQGQSGQQGESGQGKSGDEKSGDEKQGEQSSGQEKSSGKQSGQGDKQSGQGQQSSGDKQQSNDGNGQGSKPTGEMPDQGQSGGSKSQQQSSEESGSGRGQRSGQQQQADQQGGGKSGDQKGGENTPDGSAGGSGQSQQSSAGGSGGKQSGDGQSGQGKSQSQSGQGKSDQSQSGQGKSGSNQSGQQKSGKDQSGSGQAGQNQSGQGGGKSGTPKSSDRTSQSNGGEQSGQQPGQRQPGKNDSGQSQSGQQQSKQPGGDQNSGNSPNGAGQSNPAGQKNAQQNGGQQQSGGKESGGKESGGKESGAEKSDGNGQGKESTGMKEQSGGKESSGGQPDKSRNPSGEQRAAKQGEGADKQAGQGSQSRDSLEKGQQKPGEGKPSSERPGGDRDNTKGSAGAGDSKTDNQGATSPQDASRARDKRPGNSQTPSDSNNQKNSADGNSPSRSERESDSQGDSSGDQSGGGQKGGGQRANKPGMGGAGQNTAADEGGSQAKEKGSGETSGKRGDQQPAGKPVDDAASRGQGPGSKSQAGNSKAGDKQSGEKGPDSGQQANQQGQPSSGQGPGGVGNPTGGGPSDQRANGEKQPLKEAAPGDDPNLEYARKATDLALDKLKDQLKKPAGEQKLLEKLGWTRADAERFVKRWEAMKEAAGKTGAEGDAGRRQLDDALRNLGLRPRGTKISGDRAGGDRQRNLREGLRTRPPAEYADQYRAYTTGTSQAQRTAGGQEAAGSGQPAAGSK